jgi:hypothetical protein
VSALPGALTKVEVMRMPGRNGADCCLTLTLTGERRNGHLLVRVADRPLWLSCGHLQRLVRLVIARGLTSGGFVGDPDVLYPEAVCRLRRAIDVVLGPGVGKVLIETGVGREYRLAIPVARVVLDPTFADLAGLGLLTPGELSELEGLCHRCNRDVSGT